MTDCTLDTGAGTPAPLVSVVVPTFKRKNLLKETVDSILSQTFTDFELIIVDNLSDDDTQDYVLGIGDSRIRYFRNANEGIIAVNRNFGVERACGKYIAFCDDDDTWVPEKLMKQVEVLEGDESIGLCYSNATSFNVNGIVAHRMMRKRVFDNHYRHLLVGNFIANSTVLVRRKLLISFGGLSQDRRNIAVEDYMMWLAIAHHHKLSYIDESLIFYRVHIGANSSNVAKMAKKSLKVIASQYSRNYLSPFYLYALARACGRMVFKSLLNN